MQRQQQLKMIVFNVSFAGAQFYGTDGENRPTERRVCGTRALAVVVSHAPRGSDNYYKHSQPFTYISPATTIL